MQEHSGLLPFHRFLQQLCIGGISLVECLASVLNAEHHERLVAIVADRSFSGRRNAHDGALRYGEYLSVNLKLAFAAQKR